MILPVIDGFSADCTYLCGRPWSISEKDIEEEREAIRRAAERMERIRLLGEGPGKGAPVLFPHLPYILEEQTLMQADEIERMHELASFAKEKADAVISVGIGGSYLGNEALFDVCCGPYWNLASREERGGWPQCFFAGHTADPEALGGLLMHLQREAAAKEGPYQVLVLVISKSGTTIEPSGVLSVLERELPKFCRADFAAVTDRKNGALLSECKEKGWMQFAVPEGIGGRFSVFSQVGLVFASLLGIDIEAFLRGARDVEEASQKAAWRENPALAFAAMKYIATKKYGITAEITMPYGERLRGVALWYAQLLGESLGKKYDTEGRKVYAGRIPVSAVGTTDMHSLTQEQQEGKRNKLLQFISADEPKADLDFELIEDGKRCVVPMSHVLSAALTANAESLAAEERMSCQLRIARLDEYYLGALLYFFFLTVSYEGAMEGIDAYDQPGVEAYKKILHKDFARFAK